MDPFDNLYYFTREPGNHGEHLGHPTGEIGGQLGQMSYRTHHDALGQTGAIQTGVKAVTAVLADPYLNEVVCNVLRLENIQAGVKPGPPCAKTRPGLRGGIGLSEAVGPLRAFVYHREHPWIVPTAIAVIIGGTFLAGYWSGKSRRKR